MARLIDADALKETLSDLECEANNENFQSGMDFVMREFMPTVIDAQPTVTAEPKRGRWIDAREQCGSFVCSECEYQSKAQYKFCPNCGADMKNKEEKNND